MATVLTYPGVYIGEVPSEVWTITGVSTALTGFVGYTAHGPSAEATQVFNFADFERAFGRLNADSELSYPLANA